MPGVLRGLPLKMRLVPPIRADGSYVNLARYASFLLAEGLTVPSEVLRILPKIEGPLQT